MNLDDYTSKYIDGELSASEDAEMRAYLTEHDEERAEFDHAALISVAMMHESESIDVPCGLFEQTDVLVMDTMKLFAQTQSIPQRTKVRQRSAVMALLLFFVVSQFYVSDGLYTTPSTIAMTSDHQDRIRSADSKSDSPLPKTSIALVSTKSVNVAPVELQSQASKVPQGSAVHSEVVKGRHLYAVAEATASSVPSSLPSQSTYTSEVVTQNVPSIALQFATAISQVSSAYQTDNAVAARSTSGTAAGPAPTSSDALAAARKAEHPAEAVQMSTFMGTIVKSTATASSLQHFSQSIGYRVTEQDNVGVEIGSFAMLSGMQEQFGTSGTTNTPGDGLHKGTLNGSDDPPGLANGFSDGGSSARLKSVETVQTHNILWGAAYFEHAFVRGSDLNLKARVAVGTTDGGPIVLARALSSVRIYGPLAFTLGTEGRMFFLDTKNVNSPDQTLQTMLSVVYGIQVKF